ncbi:helix-turn-helix domain-containing protein [Marinobacterium arenosum]|uniref:helix-turn-helix domain-containing protein n=1 Tax=Marinobacterium arenosum TaxID=2862496 RepID=UPI001C970E65|nr:helix-turn-helix transcriptional regulator [Marinobacterium arenosum]MBY4678671.1 helix-turn-helix transcriptional regulator [Marinobacterium arenosum]
MNVQVIMKDGEPEYAILPYAEYQQLLAAARTPQTAPMPSETNRPTPERTPPVTAAASIGPEADQRLSGGARIKQLRQQKGLDDKTLARGVGISPLYLQQIEAGERQPGDAIWRSLARELGVAIDDLKPAD